MGKNQLRERYISAANSFRLLVEIEDRHLLILSIARLLSFLGGLILIWFGFNLDVTAGLTMILVIAIVFLYLLKLYSRHSEKKAFFGNLVLINKNEAESISGDQSSFEAGNEYMDGDHDFSHDVDVFGSHSLFQYLNRTITVYGRDILAGWVSAQPRACALGLYLPALGNERLLERCLHQDDVSVATWLMWA